MGKVYKNNTLLKNMTLTIYDNFYIKIAWSLNHQVYLVIK